MAAGEDDEIPPVARPDPADLDFDLPQALGAVVGLRVEVPSDAFTASVLGTERRGNGVLIDRQGLILTIGYLITEAEQVWVTTLRGMAAAAHVVAYDQATGLGLVRTLAPLDVMPLPLGDSHAIPEGAPVTVASSGGERFALSARLVARRPFAGYWEYHLDEALFTEPAHPHWGGAACIDRHGRLIGVGSLLVQELEGEGSIGNMLVPADLLPPIMDDMLRFGQPDRPPRPWLGLYATDTEQGVTVTGLAPGGPAARAGIEQGDVVVQIEDRMVENLGDLWRRLWACGTAGSVVRVTVLHDGEQRRVLCQSADRRDFLKQPSIH